MCQQANNPRRSSCVHRQLHPSTCCRDFDAYRAGNCDTYTVERLSRVPWCYHLTFGLQCLQGLATTGDSEDADKMVLELQHHPQALCVAMVDLSWCDCSFPTLLGAAVSCRSRCSILASLSKLFISSTHEQDVELVSHPSECS